MDLLRPCGLVLAAASLAACAQSSVVGHRSSPTVPRRQAMIEPDRQLPKVRNTAAVASKEQTPFLPNTKAPPAAFGLASFYTEGTQTANGERFNTHDLTAAHPTLPFGTKLRVTNVTTGRSVTVRVNDRGPFVAGRVVDVSYSAAATLGMLERGVAKVKLDVVR
jgi:rare lipoprotein A